MAAESLADTAPQFSMLCRSCREQSQQVPQPFPAYRLVRELGRGGMGVVYLAVHLQHRRTVALKMVTPCGESDPVEVERFLREARILEQLKHPNIVAFREVGEWCGKFYFAMDFIDGPNAAALVKQSHPLPIRTRRADVPESLATAIHKALSREPEDRFADVAAFRAALLAAPP